MELPSVQHSIVSVDGIAVVHGYPDFTQSILRKIISSVTKGLTASCVSSISSSTIVLSDAMASIILPASFRKPIFACAPGKPGDYRRKRASVRLRSISAMSLPR